MNTLVSAIAAPLPSFARAAGFAVLAIAAVGAAQLWQHRPSAEAQVPAATQIDQAQPLVAAPSAADMWNI